MEINPEIASPSEKTLDPADWDAMRSLGHRMIDDMFNYLREVREKPVWRNIPEDTKQFLRQPVPLEAHDPDKVYEEFLQHIFPYPLGNIHPRFWGWVIGTGSPFGVLSELLAATMNPNVTGGEHSAVRVELQVIEWLKEIFSFPKDASGVLVSGGSMANLIGLTVARNSCESEIRKRGIQSRQNKLVIYASSETHSSIQKSVEMLGLGSENLRLIPVNKDFQMDLATLEAAIKTDRGKGLK
ncbi:MAG TPA: pyridoxal-dependent decarboxylase, partial [Candidatus Hodarchaeales archaeon]|nr:pyridoxal-dependent decarboxylase [Candidatus Hodarchaeales archaeon]